MAAGAVFACFFSAAMCFAAFAGGDSVIREHYTLSTPDGRDLIMYEAPNIDAPQVCLIPSGTEVRIIKGNPEGWMLIEYNGVQGCVVDGGIVILCIGV